MHSFCPPPPPLKKKKKINSGVNELIFQILTFNRTTVGFLADSLRRKEKYFLLSFYPQRHFLEYQIFFQSRLEIKRHFYMTWILQWSNLWQMEVKCGIIQMVNGIKWIQILTVSNVLRKCLNLHLLILCPIGQIS